MATAPTAKPPVPPAVRDRLRRIRVRMLVLTGARGALATLVVLLVVVTAAFAIDAAWSTHSTLLRGLMSATVAAFAAGAFARFLVLPLWRAWGRSWEQVAHAVEDRIDPLDERWSSLENWAVRPDDTGSPAFRRRVAEESAGLAGLVDPRQVLPSREVLPWLAAAAAAFLPLAIWAAVDPPQVAVLGRRLLAPTRPITLTRLSLPNGDFVAPRGEPAAVVAVVSGRLPRTARLDLRSEDGTVRDVLLDVPTGSPEATLRHVVKKAREPFEYRVEAGDARTGWHRVGVADRPRLAGVRLTLTPPAYTNEPPKTLAALPRRLTTVRGTTLSFALRSDQPLSVAELVIEDGSALRLAPGEPGWHGLERVLTASLEFRPRLTAETGLTNENPPVCAVEVVEDRPPEVQVVTPDDEVTVRPDEKLDVQFRARDDFGVAAADLEVTINDPDAAAPRTVTIPIPLGDRQGAKSVAGSAVLDLAALDLRSGARLDYRVRVRDSFDATAAAGPDAPDRTLRRGEPRSPRSPSGDALAMNAPRNGTTNDGSAGRNAEPRNESSSPSSAPSPAAKPGSTSARDGEVSDDGSSASSSNGGMQDGQNTDGAGDPTTEPSGAASDAKPTPRYTVREPGETDPGDGQPTGRDGGGTTGDDAGQPITEPRDGSPAASGSNTPGSSTETSDGQPGTGGTAPQETADEGTTGGGKSGNGSTGKAGEPSESGSGDAKPSESEAGSEAPSEAEKSSASNSSESGGSSQGGSSGGESGSSPSGDPMPRNDEETESDEPNESGASQPSNDMARRSLDFQGAGQTGQSRSMRVVVDEWAGKYDAQQRKKLQVAVEEPMRRLEEHLKAADGKLTVLRADEAAAPDAEAIRPTDLELERADAAAADLDKTTRGTPYAFVGLQALDLAQSHVGPARKSLRAAAGSKSDESAEPNPHARHLADAHAHVRRALELLARLRGRFEQVKRSEALDQGAEKVGRMYQVFLEDSHAMLSEPQENLNPKQRKRVEYELDEEQLRLLQELLAKRERVRAELAKLMAEDPRLLQRFMSQQRQRQRTLRDRLTILARRQEDLIARRNRLESGITRPAEFDWSAVGDWDEIASLAGDLSERWTVWTPLDLKAEEPPLKPATEAVRRLATDASGLAALGSVGSGEAVSAAVVGALADLERAAAAAERELIRTAQTAAREDVAVLAVNRLAELDALARLVRINREKADRALRGEFGGVTEIDQHRLANDVRAFAETIAGAEAEYQALSAEVRAIGKRLGETLDRRLLPRQLAGVYALRTGKESTPRLLAAVTEAFAEAERDFDALLAKMIEELDAQEAPPFEIDPNEEPTLDELLALLEQERRLLEQLGLPGRPDNLQIVDDWMRQNGGGGSAAGQARQMLQAAAAQAQARDAQRRADEIRRRLRERIKELTAVDEETLRRLLDGVTEDELRVRWNTLGSRLPEHLRQSRRLLPPEQYRQAIEQYFESISRESR